MYFIEDFEVCVFFFYDFGYYFLDVKDREIKYALVSLFVDILFLVVVVGLILCFVCL